MKFLFLLLAIVTPLGVWAGYSVGSRTPQDAVLEALVSNTKIVPGAGKTYVLNYECEGKVIATFDVDTNKVITAKMTDSEVFSQSRFAKKKNREKNQYQRVYDIVVGFVTGGGAMKFGKPVFTILKAKENSKYTIPAAIGALSGFYLGYELAVRDRLVCEDFRVVIMTQDEEFWRDWLKGAVASVYLLQEVSLFVKESDSKTADDIRDIRKSIEDKKVDSTTFAKLQAVAAYVQPQQSFDGWLTFELIMAVYFPVAALLGGAVGLGVMLSDYLAKQVAKRRGRRTGAAQ